MVDKDQVARIGVSLPPMLLEDFDAFIETKGYETRSKAIADLMRNAMMQEEWNQGNPETIGAVTYVYDHHTRGLSDRLTRIQHDHHDKIISSTHIHIDHARCMEIVIIRGFVNEIRSLGDKILSTRGVLSGNLVFSAIGE